MTRVRADGRGGDGIDSLGQALLTWCRELEGGSDARVAQTSSGGVPVEQRRVGENPRERVGPRPVSSSIRVRRLRQAQCRVPHWSRGPGQRGGSWRARGGGCHGRSRL